VAVEFPVKRWRRPMPMHEVAASGR